ncbi:MAG: hypothetical protein HUU35_02275 [Armatimonadetes bacterium]|nr:hypothetical protein [Armatimonadota bacterium]
MSEREPYEVGMVSPPRKKKKHSLAAGVARAWLLETLPRLLLTFAVIWLLILLHTTYTEYGEYRGQVLSKSGTTSRMMIPGCSAPDPEDRWTTPWSGRMILAGDSFRTQTGTIDLQFYEGSVVRVLPASLVVLRGLDFERASAARRRHLVLRAGGLAVHSGSAAGEKSSFTVQVGQARIDGFGAAYVVDSARLLVRDGSLTVRYGQGNPTTVAAGKAYDLVARRVRNLAAAERRQMAGTLDRLPDLETADRIRAAVVNFEERIVLANSGWLLKLVGHEPGEGNPFAGFSVVNSSRRTQAQQRMADIHEALSGSQAPASVRLDDFDQLGLDKGKVPLLRQAFYRGQLISYQAAGDRYRLTAKATDRQRTVVVLTQAGVVKAAAK